MVAVVVGIAIALAITFLIVVIKSTYDLGYEKAKRLYEDDALRWRWHDQNYCNNKEAHRRFLDTMGAMEAITSKGHS